MIDEERRAVQNDPRNQTKSNAMRIRASFWVVALVFILLALTAVMIWVR